MANQFLMDLYSTAEGRYNRDSKDMTHGEWMCTNTSLNKRPFSFERYPFQKQIADDMHPNLDCIKPSQVGLTEIQIRKALAILSRNPNTSLIYTMPNEKMFKRISKARIKPLLDYDKAFRQDSQGKNKDSMDLMRIGTSFLYVTGSAEADATSINADFVFNDEIDLTDPSMLSLFNSRLQGSDHRVNQRFSTPTYEGVGVDRGFKRSDQHEYMLKCRSCNHWQVPVFSRSFVEVEGLPDDLEKFEDITDSLIESGNMKLETAHVVCESCRKPLNLADYENREWVAKYPSRVLNRGYRVRTFSTHRLDPKYCFTQLLDYQANDNLKGFYNTVRGEPYNNEDQKISLAQVRLAMGSPAIPQPKKGEPHFIGIDMGITCYVVVGTGTSPKHMRVILAATCHVDTLPALLEKLHKEYNFVGGGIDRYPYTPTSDAIRDASNGVIMPMHYFSSKEIAEDKDLLGEVSYLKINRTEMLDYVAMGIKKMRWQIEGYTSNKEKIEAHLQDMIREEVDESQAVWVKLQGKDHFFHALAYLAAAVCYKEIVDDRQEHQNVNTEISGPANSGSVILGQQENDIFGTANLIGYSHKTPDKIIRRHR